MLRSALVMCVALTVSGCMGSGPSPSVSTTAMGTATPTGHELKEDFDALAANGIPAGWTTYAGTWGAAANASDAVHPKVMRGMGADPPGVSSLVATPAGTFTDLEAWTSFKLTKKDAGAGLVVHFKDDQNYQIVRYSIRENAWHLFTMTDGNRLKQDNATVSGASTHPALQQWVRLRVTSTADHVEAFDGATKVIDYRLPADAAKIGGVGLFLRADQSAEFDDFEVEA